MDGVADNPGFEATQRADAPTSALAYLQQEASEARFRAALLTRRAIRNTGRALNPLRLLRRHPVATCAGVVGVAVGLLAVRQLRDYRATPAQFRPRSVASAFRAGGRAILSDSMRIIRNAIIGGLVSRIILILQPGMRPGVDSASATEPRDGPSDG